MKIKMYNVIGTIGIMLVFIGLPSIVNAPREQAVRIVSIVVGMAFLAIADSLEMKKK